VPQRQRLLEWGGDLRLPRRGKETAGSTGGVCVGLRLVSGGAGSHWLTMASLACRLERRGPFLMSEVGEAALEHAKRLVTCLSPPERAQLAAWLAESLEDR